MAASVALSESNTAAVTVTDSISNMNFGSADVPNLVPANHPIAQNQPRSFIKYFRVLLVALGGSNNIQDLRIWKSSTADLAAGESYISGGLTTTNAGPQPYATPTNLSDLASGFPTMPTSDPGAQNLGIAGFNNSVFKQMPTDTGGPPSRSNYWAFQRKITTGVTPNGALATHVFTIQYDEV